MYMYVYVYVYLYVYVFIYIYVYICIIYIHTCIYACTKYIRGYTIMCICICICTRIAYTFTSSQAGSSKWEKLEATQLWCHLFVDLWTPSREPGFNDMGVSIVMGNPHSWMLYKGISPSGNGWWLGVPPWLWKPPILGNLHLVKLHSSQENGVAPGVFGSRLYHNTHFRGWRWVQTGQGPGARKSLQVTQTRCSCS